MNIKVAAFTVSEKSSNNRRSFIDVVSNPFVDTQYNMFNLKTGFLLHVLGTCTPAYSKLLLSKKVKPATGKRNPYTF